ncbi:hypothetical protein [Agrobacterium tumefaciens]|uniref:hypothetical protein n=1 Tax=Agrobacterium tumefaciens TaxID=358 RepID=UPI00157203C6|nr:hypothetical protein [Agrobacterium tumefaciens]NSX90106.1 hypothetical protein [Agrobacterium tumefaciens]
MAKFQQIEVDGVYKFQAVNAAARKLAARFGYGLIDVRGMLMLTHEAKGNVEWVK